MDVSKWIWQLQTATRHLSCVARATSPSSRDAQNRRRDAVKQLMRIERGAYVSHVGHDMPDAFSDTETAREARELTFLVSGVTRMKLKLDDILAHYCKQPLKKLDKTAILQILRLGVFELMEMQKPPHVIHEHVQLAKRYGMAQLVNGILRNVQRDLESGTIPGSTTLDEQGEQEEVSHWLSVVYSHPEWMIRRWLQIWSVHETIQFMQNNNSHPPQGIRFLTEDQRETGLQILKHKGVNAEISAYLPSYFLRVHAGLQTVLQESHELQLVVQDEAAGMVVAVMLAPEPGERILDCCAAPGGKLFFTAQLMHNSGVLVAIEPQRSRLARMRQAAVRYGFDFIEFHEGTLQDFAAQHLESGKPLFDRVLLDVPCSGTGVMAKKADIRWKRQPEDLERLIALQDRLLNVAAQLVKPGGLLVYSTCCVEADENLQRIRAFLATHSNFSMEPANVQNEHQNRVMVEEAMQTWPHRDGIDGAFAVRLRSHC